MKKIVYGEMSVRQKVSRRSVLTAKCPYGEVSVRRSVRTAKCPTAKSPTAKSPTAKSPVTENSIQSCILKKIKNLCCSCESWSENSKVETFAGH